MIGRLQGFWNSEAGAVTVDWVVLTAGVIGLCILCYWTIEVATVDLASAAANAISGTE